MAQWLFVVLYLVTVIAVPVLTVWGWIRWTRRTQSRTPFTTASLVAFCSSTASAGLAFVTWLLAITRGFQFYDPLLLTIYKIGLLLSLIAVVYSLVGIVGPGPVRWHAPL